MDATLRWTSDPSLRRLIDQELARSYGQYYRQVRVHVRNAHDAEDVLQEFCLRALSRYWQIRQREKVGAWLSQVLRSAIVDHFRRRDRRAVALGSEIDAIAAVPPEVAGRDEERSQHFEKALGHVSPQQELLIRKLGVAGEERRTVARELGLSTNALAVRYHRAIQALKQGIETQAAPARVVRQGRGDAPSRSAGQEPRPAVMRRAARRLEQAVVSANL